jgi:hypothetical protein
MDEHHFHLSGKVWVMQRRREHLRLKKKNLEVELRPAAALKMPVTWVLPVLPIPLIPGVRLFAVTGDLLFPGGARHGGVVWC